MGDFWAVLDTVPGLPESFVVPASGILITLEFLLPIGLMIGPLRLPALRMITALFSCFGLWAIWRIAHGNTGGCGCFTGVLNLTSVQDLLLDMILLSLCLLGLRGPVPVRPVLDLSGGQA